MNTLTDQDMAARLQVNRSTVHRLRTAGIIPAGFKIGKSRRWLEDEINAWLQAGAPPRRDWEAKST